MAVSCLYGSRAKDSWSRKRGSERNKSGSGGILGTEVCARCGKPHKYKRNRDLDLDLEEWSTDEGIRRLWTRQISMVRSRSVVWNANV